MKGILIKDFRTGEYILSSGQEVEIIEKSLEYETYYLCELRFGDRIFIPKEYIEIFDISSVIDWKSYKLKIAMILLQALYTRDDRPILESDDIKVELAISKAEKIIELLKKQL